jgi:hypothetical protein
MFKVFLHSKTSNDDLKKQNSVFSSILSTENNLRHFCVAIIFDILFFLLQGPLKKFSLEPLMILATFIKGIINFHNIFKKC